MLVKFIISVLPILVFTYFKTKKSFHMLQQNWYNEGNRYLKWINKNIKKIFLNLELIFVLFFIFIWLDPVLSMILVVTLYTLLSLLYLKKTKREQTKKPLVFTKRVKRLLVTTTIIYLIPIIVFSILFDEKLLYIYYLIIGSLVFLNYYVAWLANVINKPIEKMINDGFKRKAINKLNGMTNLKVIGITGSYGKTSSKNILNDILNVKYNSFPTPKNFNTPVGLIITINNYLDKFNDLFIAEMGAFKKGEIKELCDLVHPTYGILTTIGTAHLESFGSRENIQEGKFELIESLPQDGIGILNADDPYQVSYKLKNKVKIVWIGIDNDADVKASNIKLTSDGTTFDVTFKGDKKKYQFETRLLGKANVYNILAGIALGYNLGISIPKLVMGVKKVKAVEHRLELKKMGSINIIDDAYNSNPVGSKMALDVLNLMPGKKIIVTPGMIEMGSEEYEINKTFGKQIADVCDEVILVGEKQTKPIYDGLMENKYPKNKIHVLDDVKLAFPLFNRLAEKETYVLLENDLPDIFNEDKK